MTDGLQGLVGTLRRGRSDWSSFDHPRIRADFLITGGSGIAPEIAGASEDESEHSQEEVKASPSNPSPSDRLERKLARRSSLFCTSRSVLAGRAARGLPLIPILDSDDEGSPEGQRPPAPSSSGLQDNSAAASCKRRRSSKDVMQEACHSKRESKGRRLVLEGDGPLSMGKDDLVSLAHRTRSMGCRPRLLLLLMRRELMPKWSL